MSNDETNEVQRRTCLDCRSCKLVMVQRGVFTARNAEETLVCGEAEQPSLGLVALRMEAMRLWVQRARDCAKYSELP